jgi:hypothetical protein
MCAYGPVALALIIARFDRLAGAAARGLLVFVLILACNKREVGPALPTIAQPATWTLAEPAMLVIGADDTSRVAAFGRVAGALRLPNSTIVVSDVSPPELKLFDSAGRYVRTVGRTGGGPGEFSWPGPPQRFADDSFFVLDVEQRRASFFDGEARHVLTRRFSLQLADGRFFLPIGMVSSAQFVAMLWVSQHPSRMGEPIRTPVDIVTGRFGASTFETIAKGRGDEKVGGVWQEAGHRSVVGYPLEFGSTTQVAVASGLVYLGETGKPRIDAYDLTGRLIRQITWNAPPDSVTEADRRARIVQESVKIASLPQGPDPAQLWSSVEHLRTVQLPTKAPAFTALLPARDGSLWVEQDPRPWTPTRQYLVFDSAGVLIGRVAVPRQLRVYQADDAFIVGRWRDPDQADQVRLYRISR